MVFIRKEHALPGHYGSRLPKVTYAVLAAERCAAVCPVLGRIARYRTHMSEALAPVVILRSASSVVILGSASDEGSLSAHGSSTQFKAEEESDPSLRSG
jgi:hypothetical protein